MAVNKAGGSQPHSITLISQDETKEYFNIETLQTESDYFKALFQSGMKETKEPTIQLSAISGQGLIVFKEFMETDQLNAALLEVLFEALDTALYLQAQRLIKLCNKAIFSQLSPSNCDKIEEFYNKHASCEEIGAVQKHRRAHIMEYSETIEFTNLDFDTVCALLSSSEINVPSELAVWKIILKWVKSNKEELDRLCPSGKQEDLMPMYQRLVGVVRFPAIPLTQLKSFDKTHHVNIFKGSPTFINVADSSSLESVCRDYCSDAMKYHTTQGFVHISTSTQTEIRNPVKVLIALGGFTAKEAASSQVQYTEWDSKSASTKQNTEEWDLKSASANQKTGDSFTLIQKSKWRLPSQLCENGACVLNNVLYIAGGQTKYQEDGRYTSNKVYQFDPTICSWKEVASMHVPRSLFYFGQVRGSLYAVCGWLKPETVTLTVEKYNPNTDTWTMCPSLTAGPHEHAGCSLNGELYISGGFKGPNQGHLDKLWKYDEAEADWLTLAPMVSARSYHAMVAIGDSILVAGGVCCIGNDSFEDVKTCELYNPSTNQWAVLHTDLPHPASCMSFLYSGHSLYLFGGHSFEEDTDHSYVMVLDCQKWEWTERKLKSKTSYFTAAVLDVPRYSL